MTDFMLLINFRGACTHFHNDVLGFVPHRVVFPNATQVRPGLLAVATDNPENYQPYFLMPHVVMMKMAEPEAVDVFEVDGLVDDTGYAFSALRLSVANAIDPGVTYPGGTFESLVTSLPSVVANYTYSEDVVVNGRASAYFDITAGAITASLDGEAVRVTAAIRTDGAPQLSLEALHPLGQPVDATTITLPVVGLDDSISSMFIGNIGTSCEFGQFDYLLHLLTSRAGIPRFIPAPLPGMGQDDCPPAEESFRELVKSGYPLRLGPVTRFDTFASCSDSRYP